MSTDQNTKGVAAAALMPLHVIWVCLFMSQVAFYIIANRFFYLSPSERAGADASLHTLKMLLSAIAFLTLLTTILLPPLIFNQKRNEIKKAHGRSDTLSTVQLIPFYKKPYLTRIFLAEMVGFLGFISARFAGDANAMIPHLTVVAILFLVSFPTEHKVRETLKTH